MIKIKAYLIVLTNYGTTHYGIYELGRVNGHSTWMFESWSLDKPNLFIFLGLYYLLDDYNKRKVRKWRVARCRGDWRKVVNEVGDRPILPFEGLKF